MRCIVASLTDDSSNELADVSYAHLDAYQHLAVACTITVLYQVCIVYMQELVTGEPALVDLDEESDSEEQDFESWKPDPVDADPSM